jgi:Gram-negative bacterial TonB protein C-terminal
MKLITLTLLSAIIFCSTNTVVYAQGDTLQKFPNGNLILRNKPGFRLQNADGTVLCSWEGIKDKVRTGKKEIQIIGREQGGKSKYGIIDLKEGELILPQLYDGIYNIRSAYAALVVLKQGNLKGFFSVDTKAFVPLQFVNYTLAIGGNFIGFKDSTAYLYNQQLQFTDSIPGMYGHRGYTAYPRDDNPNIYLIAQLKDGEGLLDNQNHFIHKRGWLQIIQLKGAHLLVKTKEGIGVYNVRTNKLEEPYQYDACLADEGSALYFLQQKQHWKIMDSSGNKLAHFEAAVVIASRSWEAFFFKQKERWGLMNRNGKIIQTPIWTSVSNTDDNNLFEASLPGDAYKLYSYVFSYTPLSRTLTGIKEGSNGNDISITQEAKIEERDMGIAIPPVEDIRISNVVEMPHAENDTTIFIRMEIDPSCRQDGKTDTTFIKEKIIAAKKEKHITAHGTVTIRVVIEKDGKMSRTEILETDNEKLNAPSIEIVQQLNNWQPGIQNGRNIRGYKKLVLRW